MPSTRTVGLSASLQQLRDCQHRVLRKRDNYNPDGHVEACLTCRFAAQIMKMVSEEKQVEDDRREAEQALRELLWARKHRDKILMRHPTNWPAKIIAQCSSVGRDVRMDNVREDDSSAPPKVTEKLGGSEISVAEVDRSTHNNKKTDPLQTMEERGHVNDEKRCANECRRQSWPESIPGALITLAQDCGEALLNFAEEVQGRPRESNAQREKAALDLVHEAVAEVTFTSRRDGLRTAMLVTKLQAVVRGWIARRLARALLLEGGCRREFDGASGTWQYAWPWRPALSKTACTADTIVCTRNWRVSQGVAVHGESGGWGEEAFRSWYPPALLKNETLPSPRAALRRLQGERQIREAHLALANSLLDEQKENLRKREARSMLLVALGEVIKLVERAAQSIVGVSLDPPALDDSVGERCIPPFSIRVLHHRGGSPTDGARAGSIFKTMAEWRRREVQAHKAKERGQSAKRGRSTVSPTSASPKRVGGEGRGRGISPGKDCRANVRTPTTNENLADFEQRILQNSGHATASAAVASLLRQRRVAVAIRDGMRLIRNKDAWPVQGTFPIGLSIQAIPPWFQASQRFVALAHAGRLTAISQASPCVCWKAMKSQESRGEALRALLEPFSENADILRGMLANGRWQLNVSRGIKAVKSYSAATLAATTVIKKSSPSKKGYQSGSFSGTKAPQARGDVLPLETKCLQPGVYEMTGSPPVLSTDRASLSESDILAAQGRCLDHTPSGSTVKRERKAGSQCSLEGSEGSSLTARVGSEAPVSWGYRSSLAPYACRKIDALAIARKDESVELGFDSLAFEIILDFSAQRIKRFKGVKRTRGEAGGTYTSASTGSESATPSLPHGDKPYSVSTATGASSSATITTMKDTTAAPGGGSRATEEVLHQDMSTRVLVSNVIPFRLEEGLPPEVGPLLFDAEVDASVLVGDSYRPGGTQGKVNGQEHGGAEDTEVTEGSWARRPDPFGAGDIWSHWHCAADGTNIEVRVRAGELAPEGLMRAGMSKDLSALIVSNGGDINQDEESGGVPVKHPKGQTDQIYSDREIFFLR